MITAKEISKSHQQGYFGEITKCTIKIHPKWITVICNGKVSKSNYHLAKFGMKTGPEFFSPSSCCQHIFCCRFSCKATPARENSQLRVTERRNVSYQKVANPARRCSNNNVRTINGKSFVKLRFIARGERETDRTHLPSENKLNTKMEASLDLVITWMFTPMVILVAFLQVGSF